VDMACPNGMGAGSKKGDFTAKAIWGRYPAAMPHADLDMSAIVERSRLFTPCAVPKFIS
jgi:hypothetical protein